jgi:hypothetical protein
MSRLTKAQAAALNERIGPMMNYLYRFRERLSKRGFLLSSPSIMPLMLPMMLCTACA